MSEPTAEPIPITSLKADPVSPGSNRRGLGRALLRAIGYAWATPLALAGVFMALVLRGGSWRISGGVVECLVPRLIPSWAEAQTYGWVVLYRRRGNAVSGSYLDAQAWASGFHAIYVWTFAHEHCHVEQALRWGILFPVAYFVATMQARWRGQDWYMGNRFEIAAFEAGLEAYKRAQWWADKIALEGDSSIGAGHLPKGG